MQREFKSSRTSGPLKPPMKLKEDAFQRPIEIKESLAEREEYLKSIYQTDAVYEFKSANDSDPMFIKYKKQIELLCAEMKKIAKDYIEDTSPITKFADHFIDIIKEKKASVPVKLIKQTLEKIIYQLQKKLTVDEEKIRTQLSQLAKQKEQKLDEDFVKTKITQEKLNNAEFETRKQLVLEMLLPEMSVCDIGILGNLDFAHQFLSGNHSLEHLWTEMRTQYVTDYSFRHKKLNPKITNVETHVDVLLRNEALKHGWNISSDLQPVEDKYIKQTLMTAAILNQFEAGFSDKYNLRTMTDAVLKKFEELLSSKQNLSGWFPYSQSIYNFAEDILSRWGLPIQVSDIFEKKEELGNLQLKFSPLRFKQLFWQDCRRRNRFVDQDSWSIINTLFPKYHLYHANGLVFTPLAWLQDAKTGDFIAFDALTKEEQIQYHIFSIVHFGKIDQFQWLKPSRHLLDVFDNEKDFAILANALKQDNQWQKQQKLLKILIKERPQYFAMLLAEVNPNVRSDILDLVNVELLWPKPNEQLHMALNSFIPNEKLKQEMQLRLDLQKKRFDDFQSRHGFDSKEIPLLFSKLLKVAEKAAPEDQFIFKIYMERYFPYEFEKMLAENQLNYANNFIEAYKKLTVNMNEKNKNILSLLLDGNLKELQQMKLLASNLTITDIKWIKKCNHQHLINYLFVKQKYSAASNLAYWLVAFDRHEPDEDQILPEWASTRIGDNRTLLHIAAIYGSRDWIKKLLANGADINAKDASGVTPLALACAQCDIGLTDYLIECGANINATANDLTTPIFQCYPDVIKTCLEHGAWINCADNEGNTPIIFSVNNNLVDSVNTLLENGAKADIIRNNAETPLHHAAYKNNFSIVKSLLLAGANPVTMPSTKNASQFTTEPKIKKLLQSAENKQNNQEAYIELKLFENFRFKHTPDDIRQCWIENQKGELVQFDELPKSEQMRYFVYSTTRFGFPDFAQLSLKSPSLFDVFNPIQNPESYTALVNSLMAENAWDKQKALLKFIYHERPHHFVKFLDYVKDTETRTKILDLVEINYDWLNSHAKNECQLANIAADQKHEEVALWLADQWNKAKEKLATFKTEHKLEKNQPITFKTLLKITEEKLTPNDQFIFKIYYERLPFREAQTDKKNYAMSFSSSCEKYLKQLDGKNKIIFNHILDDKLSALKDMDLSFADISRFINCMHTFSQQELLDFFYNQVKQDNHYHQSPLKWMVEFNRSIKEEEVEAVLSVQDLDINGKSDFHSPLFLAAANGLNSWVKILLEKNAIVDSINTNEPKTPLYEAVLNQHSDIVFMLLEKGANVNFSYKGVPILMNAITLGNHSIASLLIENGARIDTAMLMTAAKQDTPDIMQLLLQKKPELNTLAPEGSVLMAAAKNTSSTIVLQLLEARADPSLKHEGKTAFQYAINPENKRLLLLAEIKHELNKIKPAESKIDNVALFAKSQIELRQSIEKLIAFIEGKVMKEDYDLLKDKLNKEPWLRFYQAAKPASIKILKPR